MVRSNEKVEDLKTGVKMSQKQTSLKLSKGQKKRVKKKLKQNAPNTASLKTVETVVFENPDAGPSTNTTKRKAADAASGDGGIETDLKQARFEVMKFGMNSMKATEKYDAETALAISLGAKPGKKEYINYKDLLVKRKAEIEKEREDEEMQKKTKVKPKKTKKDKVRNQKKGDGGIVKVKNLKQFLSKPNSKQRRKK